MKSLSHIGTPKEKRASEVQIIRNRNIFVFTCIKWLKIGMVDI